MNGDQIANLAYLGLLGGAIAFYYFASNRQGLGKTLQQLMLWALIFIGVIAAYGMWGDIRSTVIPQQSLSMSDNQLQVPRSPDGHYYLTLDVNETPVRFMVDTGASMVVLTKNDASKAGLDVGNLTFWGTAITANGPVEIAPVVLDRLGPFSDRDVRASVNGGEMEQSLLGMSYLGLFDSVQIRNDRLILSR